MYLLFRNSVQLGAYQNIHVQKSQSELFGTELECMNKILKSNMQKMLSLLFICYMKKPVAFAIETLKNK